MHCSLRVYRASTVQALPITDDAEVHLVKARSNLQLGGDAMRVHDNDTQSASPSLDDSQPGSDILTKRWRLTDGDLLNALTDLYPEAPKPLPLGVSEHTKTLEDIEGAKKVLAVEIEDPTLTMEEWEKLVRKRMHLIQKENYLRASLRVLRYEEKRLVAKPVLLPVKQSSTRRRTASHIPPSKSQGRRTAAEDPQPWDEQSEYQKWEDHLPEPGQIAPDKKHN